MCSTRSPVVELLHFGAHALVRGQEEHHVLQLSNSFFQQGLAPKDHCWSSRCWISTLPVAVFGRARDAVVRVKGVKKRDMLAFHG